MQYCTDCIHCFGVYKSPFNQYSYGVCEKNKNHISIYYTNRCKGYLRGINHKTIYGQLARFAPM